MANLFFHIMILGRLGKGYCKKNRVLEFLPKIFGLIALAPLSYSLQILVKKLVKDYFKYLSQKLFNKVLDLAEQERFNPDKYMCGFEKFA